jgi:hypothetical protein
MSHLSSIVIGKNRLTKIIINFFNDIDRLKRKTIYYKNKHFLLDDVLRLFFLNNVRFIDYESKCYVYTARRFEIRNFKSQKLVLILLAHLVVNFFRSF